MTARRRAIEVGAYRGRSAVATIGRELEEAIRNLGLSYASVGRDVGLSDSQVGRVARGHAPSLTIVQASELLAAVGHELSVRTFPTGQPMRDRARLALLERLRRVVHPSLTWRTEVPVAGPGDLRAWDAVIGGPGWSRPVEAEVRLGDIQALERRLGLKQRDGSADSILLLVWDTRHNRVVQRSIADAIASTFPLPGRRALVLLAAGVDPGASSLILI